MAGAAYQNEGANHLPIKPHQVIVSPISASLVMIAEQFGKAPYPDANMGQSTVSASCVCATISAHMGRLVSERDKTDARRATRLILERRSSQKATVLGGGNNSSEAENSSS
jgi:hypothetical protein